MIATLLIIALMFLYLGYETKWFTVRLESTAYQKKQAVESKSRPIKTESNDNIPYWWKSAEEKAQSVILCHNQWDCQGKNQCRKTERWTGWKLLPKTIQAFGHTINLAEGCNIARASLLKDVAKAQKPRKVMVNVIQQPLNFVEEVRIGSHHEWVRWNHETNEMDFATKYKEGYHHRVVTDYTTKYHDCLCGKDWLKEHSQDEYPEPTIEISANGKSISVNGNYKKGLIKDFVKSNK